MQADSVHLHCWIFRLNHKQGAKHEILKLQLNHRRATVWCAFAAAAEPTRLHSSEYQQMIKDNHADVRGLQFYWSLLGSSFAVWGCDADSLWHAPACVADRLAWQMLVPVSQHLLFSRSVLWHHEDHWTQSHLKNPPTTHSHAPLELPDRMCLCTASSSCLSIQIPPVLTLFNIHSFLKVNITDSRSQRKLMLLRLKVLKVQRPGQNLLHGHKTTGILFFLLLDLFSPVTSQIRFHWGGQETEKTC